MSPLLRKRCLKSPNSAPSAAHSALSLAAVLQNLSFSAQNCNSLNISTNCPKQSTKIKSIIDLDSDIILLSDLRLNNKDTTRDIEKIFLSSGNRQYKFYHNSLRNSRGVGILISSNLNCEIISPFSDEAGNILGLYINLDSHLLLLVSIYGPNKNNDNIFFQDLNRLLRSYPDIPAIIGGDWNLTYSTANTDSNIDIFRMGSPPSLIRSRALADLCERFQLSDPFRALHPDLLDFSFRPKNGRNNRSRLDFFLTSDSLIEHISTCTISPEIANSLFDHHYISLKFNSKKFNTTQSINHSILSHPRFMHVVTGAAVDCYLSHASDNTPGIDIPRGKAEVGAFLTSLQDLNNLELDITLNGPTNLKELTKAGLVRELDRKLVELPDPDQLNLIPLTCANDYFLEALMSSMKCAVISFQSFIRKVSTAKKSQLISNINRLRDDFIINSAAISELQQELNDLVNCEVKSKIQAMKLFEGLNDEKPRPIFLSLAKSRNTGKLSKIRKEDNSDFASDEERNEFIVSFFEKLYKKPSSELVSHENVIEDFLGEEICNSQIVQNSKLTALERECMESGLTLPELDLSIKNANLRSASGVDGFSNIMIKKCWHLLRLPLLNYAQTCFDKGELTPNFRGATIRLIPKKSDASSLKNWRPISLLSNMYKIISRALNERLNKVVNRICSRAQKGFNKHRYTQEVLINVWESIQKSKNLNSNGAVMAIDMAKAFDTLSNSFLDQVFKFFGFGPIMRNWLKLVGTNRSACVILDDGKFSRNFNLERGRPQGDNISPNTFNFAIQILIFRLELDNAIIPIPSQAHENIPPANIPNFFMYESNRETVKNEGLADDNTSLVLLDLDTLQAVKTALDSFGSISGLVCNYDKSVIMPINQIPNELTDRIKTLGFTVSDSFKLLGMEIKNSLDNIPDIYRTILGKIQSLILFWERFRLSLPGRITIMKTCLISQVNYIGCFLPAPPDILEEIQTLIDGFVKSNLRVAFDRLYLPPSAGGLGIFNLTDFLKAQNCTWILRAHRLPIDNWRTDLRSNAPSDNILLIRSSDICKSDHPILHNLARSYEDFYGEFSKINGNYKLAYIFENPAFCRNNSDLRQIDKKFFGQDFENSSAQIRKLTFSNCFIGNRVKSQEELAEMGVILSPANWMRLQGALLSSRNRLRKNSESESLAQSIEDFMGKVKKGSKKFRLVLENCNLVNSEPSSLRTVITFSNLVSVQVPDKPLLSKCLNLWNYSWIPNDMRNFLFLLRNNALSLNNRLNAWDPDISPYCTFCRIIDRDTRIRDGFLHFFFECPVTFRLLQQWGAIFEPPFNPNLPSFLQLYWYGSVEDQPFNPTAIIFICDCFKYVLWKFKQRRKIPNFVSFRSQLLEIIYNSSCMNKSLKLGIQNNNLIANFLQARG